MILNVCNIHYEAIIGMIEQLSRIIIPAYGDWNELIGSMQDTSTLQEE